jgi:signal transduction histidine kinase/FixJ family two-component response regulator
LSNLKLEAAVFALIALTSFAVLCESAVTGKKLALTPTSGQYYTYTYADHKDGGTSHVQTSAVKPLDWTCSLGKGFTYPYCGFGLFIDLGNTGKGVDFRHFKTVDLHIVYHGQGRRLKLTLKNRTPPGLRGKVSDNDITFAAEFDVKDGDNVVQLNMDQFGVDSWWATSHHLTPEEVSFPLDHVLAVAINSDDQPAPSRFDVSIKSINFSGAFISRAQWYLIILGVWLALTGGFLVYRFLSVRRAMEARQRMQAEEARLLAVARDAAESASSAKSQFLANMSHELRTPLNAIIGYAQLLQQRSLPDESKDAARTIEQSGAHLLTLITDILDISKVEAGKLDFLPEDFDLHDCLRGVANMMRLRAEEKGLAFVLDLSALGASWIRADQKRLRQVLINLLGNAIKFTQDGEVRLSVRSDTTPQGEIALDIEVSDTGIGIDAASQARIFRPFEQAGNAVDRSAGAGLGLSISHRIVAMMNGKIEVDSAPGQGARFQVRIHCPAGEAPASAATDQASALAGRRILIVDDLDANLDLLRDALRESGCDVIEARNGEDALAMLDTTPIDLVLLDERMPVMDGETCLRELRRRVTGRLVPVVMISADPSLEKVDAALAAGATAAIAKPVDLHALRCKLAQILESPAQNDATPVTSPDADILEPLLILAREGNLRALRKEVPGLLALGPQYAAFAQKLDALAAAYQSPAVLRLIEQCYKERRAA